LPPDAWSSRALILCALERYNDAVTSFKKALDVNPQIAHARHNKGAALIT
jgi:tetratricopeptide (TPR) repeat protein